MKILIVEDDFISRQVLGKFLGEQGSCDIAVNGKEALEAFKLAIEARDSYDLVCLDIMMPEMDGQTALQEIRVLEEAHGVRSSRGATVLMTTALDDVRNIMTAFHGLCDGYLVKPVARAKLIQLLEQFELCPPAAPKAGANISLA